MTLSRSEKLQLFQILSLGQLKSTIIYLNLNHQVQSTQTSTLLPFGNLYPLPIETTYDLGLGKRNVVRNR